MRFEAKLLLDNPKYKAIGYEFVTLNRNGLLVIYQYLGCTYRIRIRKADEEGELPLNNLSRTLKITVSSATRIHGWRKWHWKRWKDTSRRN